MEDNTCPVFVDGKACGLPLSEVDREAKKIARYDFVTYECGLGHRSYFLREPKAQRDETVVTRPRWSGEAIRRGPAA
jgi:hypothetical protein